jgi:hypothetical protein
MKEKTVLIEIDEQGNSSIDLEGFRGGTCSDVAKEFKGKDSVRNIRNKIESYSPGVVVNRQHRQN